MLQVRGGLAVMLCLGLAGSVPAQEVKEEKVAGTIIVGRHEKALEAGKIYHIKVEGKDFQPNLSWGRSFVSGSSVSYKDNVYQGYFSPRESLTYKMFVVPNFFVGNPPEGPLEYTLTIRPIVLSKDPVFEKKAELVKDDPIYANPKLFFNRKSHFKAFPLKMDAKKFYTIEMIRNTNEMDPYLFLEGPDGAIVGQDDDGAGNLNSRLIFQPQLAGEYRIIATTLSPATGGFTLTVRGEGK